MRGRGYTVQTQGSCPSEVPIENEGVNGSEIIVVTNAKKSPNYYPYFSMKWSIQHLNTEHILSMLVLLLPNPSLFMRLEGIYES